MSREIPEPWRAFLGDLDRELVTPVELHCLGGFVVTMLYAHAVPLDIGTLRARYQEMRPCLGNPEREDLTLKLWIDAIEEKRMGSI
jgi:hypothetical protein